MEHEIIHKQNGDSGQYAISTKQMSQILEAHEAEVLANIGKTVKYTVEHEPTPISNSCDAIKHIESGNKVNGTFSFDIMGVVIVSLLGLIWLVISSMHTENMAVIQSNTLRSINNSSWNDGYNDGRTNRTNNKHEAKSSQNAHFVGQNGAERWGAY